ncbi:MAG: SpoIID/LytB domain-containing protein [Flavobacteriales bacterium]|nr:SpoIID/LytB domain-containing protein [Flavobacteriales bacterium]
MRSLTFIIASLATVLTCAQRNALERELRVGLFNEGSPAQLLVMGAGGNCMVLADGVRKGELTTADGLRIRVADGRLSAKSLALAFTAKRIEIRPLGEGFRMRDPAKQHAERAYPGVLEVSVVNGRLQLIDRVPLEAYTAGVVSAEAGKEHHQEYYKLQSVSCRTYALTNQTKHKLDGFDLCDGVHCQVFQGRNRNDSISMAVRATRGLVIVDPDIKLIHATFHSNCGGETMNAEDLWSKSEPYLRATVDTFCTSAPHARWEKTMARSEWLDYLERRYGLKALNTSATDAVLHYEPHCRDLYLGNTWPLIP